MTITETHTTTITHLVEEKDSATNWGNDVPVLATPVLLWLAEIACMKSYDHELEPGHMTVGVSHDATHLAPTPIGGTVTICATLRARSGRKLEFDVEANDGSEAVFQGTHVRGIIDRSRFIDRVREKASHLTTSDK